MRAVFAVVISHGGQAELDAVLNQLNDPNLPSQDYEVIASTMGMTTDPECLDRVLEFSLSEKFNQRSVSPSPSFCFPEISFPVPFFP